MTGQLGMAMRRRCDHHDIVCPCRLTEHVIGIVERAGVRKRCSKCCQSRRVWVGRGEEDTTRVLQLLRRSCVRPCDETRANEIDAKQ
jgi:hypothetical protein